jgi:hypothetical protein
MIVTEKLDGTNASVMVVPKLEKELDGWPSDMAMAGDVEGGVVQNYLYAGSRKRFINPDNDNFGFARWVCDNAEELIKLGPGTHFGEWWGKGIQRGYDLDEKRFSLFNVMRWADSHSHEGDLAPKQSVAPACCHVVPVIYHGPFDLERVEFELDYLKKRGSWAVDGFMNPEGIMIYHTAANQIFKKTFDGDEHGKDRGA